VSWKRTKKKIVKDKEYIESLEAQRDRLWDENEYFKEALMHMAELCVAILDKRATFKVTMKDGQEVVTGGFDYVEETK
jgi:hypothetical protein